MKKIMVLAAGVMMGAMLLTACGGASGSTATGTTSSAAAGTTSSAATSTTSSAAASTATSSAQTPAVKEDPADLTPSDLVNPDRVIGYGDYKTMEAFSKDIQNGNATGTVVLIDGEVINFARGMSYSIGQKDPESGSRIGTTFVIVGGKEDSYPKDTTHVKIYGKVFYDADSFSFKIYTLPDFVEVVE